MTRLKEKGIVAMEADRKMLGVFKRGHGHTVRGAGLIRSLRKAQDLCLGMTLFSSRFSSRTKKKENGPAEASDWKREANKRAFISSQKDFK